MYLAKYLGNGFFETKSKDKTKITRILQISSVKNVLKKDNFYLVCNVDNKLAVLPIVLQDSIISSVEINENNDIEIKANTSKIKINNDNNIEITLGVGKKLLLNNIELLTMGAVINAPNGPCTIASSGQV